MSARAAWFMLLAVYLVVMFVLLWLVGHVFGFAWELGLIPVEMAGGFAIGTLAGQARAR